MDGWGLIKRIKNNPETSQMVCIAITAYHSSEVALEAGSNGFAAYFPKPLNPNSFVKEIAQVVGELDAH